MNAQDLEAIESNIQMKFETAKSLVSVNIIGLEQLCHRLDYAQITGRELIEEVRRLTEIHNKQIATLRNSNSIWSDELAVKLQLAVHGKPWEYIFYVDCQIKSSDEGSLALAALTRHCAMVKELGRYREASQ